jgi:hypothetical protein
MSRLPRMQQWQTGPNGDWSTTVRNVKLVIHNAGSFVGFLLFRRPGLGRRGETLLESGCEENVNAAKARAIERAMKVGATSAAGRHRWRT